jgi:hypothetical protein
MPTLTTGGAEARGGVVSTAMLHTARSFTAYIIMFGSLQKLASMQRCAYQQKQSM